MIEGKLLNALNSLTLEIGVLWYESLGCDVEAQELGVDCVEDGWDEWCDQWSGGG